MSLARPFKLLTRLPATGLLLAVFLVAGLLTETVLRTQYPAIKTYVGWDVDTLKALRWWRQMASTFVQATPGFTWHQPVLLTLLCAPLEMLAGSRALLITFVASDWISSPITTAIIWAASKLDYPKAQALLHHASTGSSAATLACGAGAAALLPGRWGIVGSGFAIGIVLQSFTYQSLDTSIAHLLAAMSGIALSLTLWKKLEGSQATPLLADS